MIKKQMKITAFICLFAYNAESLILRDAEEKSQTKITKKCLEIAQPPWFVQILSNKTEEESYEASVAAAQVCCKQIAPDGDIGKCKCPLADNKKTKKYFEQQIKPWCVEMILYDCVPEHDTNSKLIILESAWQ